ncbi:UDP-N-acetylglucosamine--N-acetylmuramyl-(pentapeptide) pyrophosphoryl-undecaprenol N-acetylglucosamine transferase [Rhodobium orientis]|uniref:UDP-N-acetylglucosamine--N-acetylmuramyl-(pentapeptide) pyrophosphoryl-undecaprenol N-acetylglucosamine transferase n=1 Tax=Rhodobium orientis TaxID=34017 RepID=A0A327JG24_9HYPH|nr:undecaprenyldiphospho-muramoylpentapeptide beta-N-acetylglucosaminyltransferase [Rhodobium orientis]MBB4305461.1 UDP-N-acetylglucosamine--N-acetylmuramyl-(pentapeptide) pyrophosphoryl-undecaprenol N-acetylglucosamine transferase [Rhodobium orientis]MBK5948657.1 undecaprenyldiphospho-muramoylpentapeptide beta-N-acetylglucosaminyltransferase [Rhodobium orientis]RAI25279.1 undecaprenyldiphospho-muramoylpentapeptide beta-N-acetylglucosaminyltransferase [Rhodobium orientis]
MTTVLIAAGGTGGHLFPAEALAEALTARGCAVDLATDERADRYGSAFPARATHIVSSATLTGKSPVALVRTAFALAKGVWQSLGVIGRVKPDVVVGFGGYPTFPPLIAAFLRGVPIVLHEQNAVTGRANRMLGRLAKAVATSFPGLKHGDAFAGKSVHTGNPVRPTVIAAAEVPYDEPSEDRPFRLVVFGGSQGARYFSESLPEAVRCLPEALRARLDIVQQCRPEDMDAVTAAYDALGLTHDCAPFFTDMPARIASAHLVIARSGASTVTELAVIGRPSILVPFPYALDHDQAANAEALAAEGGAIVIRQCDLPAERLAEEIAARAADGAKLAATAQAAKAVGRPDAAARLADLVQHIASGADVQSFSPGVSQ